MAKIVSTRRPKKFTISCFCWINVFSNCFSGHVEGKYDNAAKQTVQTSPKTFCSKCENIDEALNFSKKSPIFLQTLRPQLRQSWWQFLKKSQRFSIKTLRSELVIVLSYQNLSKFFLWTDRIQNWQHYLNFFSTNVKFFGQNSKVIINWHFLFKITFASQNVPLDAKNANLTTLAKKNCQKFENFWLNIRN